MKPQLSTRQAEVAGYVAKGHPDKIIAKETGLSIKTVQHYIQHAAANLPGETSPRHRLTHWFFNLTD
jgi:DNA-binding NarL/FixJ family response regulator